MYCLINYAIPLCKQFKESSLLIWGGFAPMVLGRLLYIPWGDAHAVVAYPNATLTASGIEIVGCPILQTWCLSTPAMTITQFLLGYLITCLGYPIGSTMIQTIFSKKLGPRPQGVWMGFLTAFGCLSLILGPVCVGVVYTRYGTYAIFGFTSIMLIVAATWMWLFRYASHNFFN